jgi:hypothetical protein
MNKFSYYFEYFNYCDFFTYDQASLKIEKNKNLTKYYFLWSKMTLSGIINIKTSKSPDLIFTYTI